MSAGEIKPHTPNFKTVDLQILVKSNFFQTFIEVNNGNFITQTLFY